MHDISITIFVISAVGILMMMATATLFLSKLSKIPFTILLVVIGYAAERFTAMGPEAIRPFADFSIQPDIILYACLPTLIFESAFTLDSRMLKHNILPVLTLAIPGLFLSTFIIGGLVHLLTGMNFLTALLLGSILSATDPVAVIALFKQLGVPKRLVILVEGESLFNDSTAIVTAKTIMFIILAGEISGHTLGHGAYEFCFEFFGGIFVGYILTRIIGWIISYLHEESIAELSLTLILAYGSFIIADAVHTSGVMAVITSGVMMAAWGRTKLSPETHHQLHTLLEFLAYITNSLIFLLVGWSIDFPLLYNSAGTLAVVLAAMLFSRAIVIYGLIPLISKFPSAEPISMRYQTIMWWGGLRGAIALAIVLGLTDIENQQELSALVMGAVLFTIIIQGLSINRVIKWLKLDIPLLSDRVARIEAKLIAEKAALERIPDLQRGGLFSLKIAESLKQSSQYALKSSKSQLDALRRQELNTEEERKILYLSCFTAEKFLYFEMFNKGNLSENTYSALVQDLNFKIDAMRYRGELLEHRSRNLFMLIKDWIEQSFSHIPVLDRIVNQLKLRDTIADYEFKWAAHQGCISVLSHLDEIANVESIDKEVEDEVRKTFERWKQEAQHFIDNVTAQFPEFVTDTQQRLAERLLLNTREDAVIGQAHHGLLSEGDAHTMVEEFHEKINELRRIRKRTLVLDPHELIRKVPFFTDIPENGTEDVLQKLSEYRANENEIVIQQGAEEDELYIIMRGVVRVIVDIGGGKTIDVATLMAGDFFGEMAMLEGVKRTATCKTVTPCVLYVLKRKDFEALCINFPTIKESLMQEAEKRHMQNKD